MADIREINGEIVLNLFGLETLEQINDALLKHANETMEVNAVGIQVEYPVLNAGKKIGRVTIEASSTEYIFEHYTLCGKKLFNEFSALEFYSGAYGALSQ